MILQSVMVIFKDFQSKKLSDPEKKELILKARTKAAGWAFFGEAFSTLYYGLRSNNTVAKKNLILILLMTKL